MHSWKSQNQFRDSRFLCRGFDPNCPVPRKVPAEDASYVEQRAASADQAGIMGAVTDNLALGTQDGILQRNRIEKVSVFGSTLHF